MAREQRKLAAIVAADVVGYSRLMGRDESGTLAQLRRARSERLEPALARYGGHIVKLTGDGALIEFASAVDALAAAIEFQRSMAKNEADRPEGERLVFRVGLHLGDVIVDDGDLYGDGVNVSARLQAEAEPGGIIVSGAVKEATAGRLKATFDDLGLLKLKNIERPVSAFAVRWQAADWEQADTPFLTVPAQKPPGEPLRLKIRGWLKAGHQHVAVVRALTVFIVFFLDPLGVATQKTHAIDDALGWLSGNFWGKPPSERLAVVLITEEDLQSPYFQLDWPLPYGKLASMVHMLACNGAVGVFFDFTPAQQFNLASGFNDLKEVMEGTSKISCDDAPPKPIQVFFGTADAPDTPLAQYLNRVKRAFWIGGSANAYLYPPGPVEFPLQPASEAKDQSPAFGLVQRFCLQKSGSDDLCPNREISKATHPIQLAWTARQSKYQHRVLRARQGIQCREQLSATDPKTYFELARLLLGLPGANRNQSCPPILTYVARQLYEPYKAGDSNPLNFIAGRFVFVGVNLAGLNDTVSSPVHGNLPGVYAHAVALDNLLLYGPRYPTAPEPYVAMLIAAFVYLAVELYREASGSAEKALVAALLLSLPVAAIILIFNWPFSTLISIFGYYVTVSTLLDRVARNLRSR